MIDKNVNLEIIRGLNRHRTCWNRHNEVVIRDDHVNEVKVDVRKTDRRRDMEDREFRKIMDLGI